MKNNLPPEVVAQRIASNILADRVQRGVQWCAFAGIVACLVVPLAVRAVTALGMLAGLGVLALGLALAWHVKPAGRSYASTCAAIDRGEDP